MRSNLIKVFATVAILTINVIAKEQQRWAAFPVVASSTETGLIYGGMLFHFLPVKDLNQQASMIDLIAYKTTKGQYAISLSPNLLLQNDYRLRFGMGYRFWKANYYAIGNDSSDEKETYTAKNKNFNLVLEKKFNQQYIINILATVKDTKMDIVQNGMLDNNILGSEDKTYTGIGFAVGYDTRDNTNYAKKGNYLKYSYLNYSSQFTIQHFDIRNYTNIDDSIIASALTYNTTNGDVPFEYLSTPDGTNILRGIERGRYKDNDMLALQIEYRFPIKGNFYGATFAEAAQVFHSSNDIKLKEFKHSLGGGIRYAINQKQRLHIRSDLSYVDGRVGVTITIRSAF